MNQKFLAATLTAFLTLFFVTRAVVAQSVYGQISGAFTDASGVPIRDARVSVVSEEKGTKFRTSTNQSGNFTITDLLPDTYVVTMEADGFKTFQETNVPVFADQTSRIAGKLPRGNAADLVTGVPGDASILKTDRTDVSTMFTQRDIDNLPVRDLNVSRFELLVPGALPTVTSNLSTVQNPQGGNLININGQHFSGTAFQLDGTDNRDPLQGLIVINPTLESVNEMKVTTQNYSAEFGEATAGVVTIQTRSGTNSWHGSGFDYRRSDWGQASQPFAFGGVPPTRRNEFGGSVGGPVVNSKLFLFDDYQGTRQSVGFNQLLSVPTALVQQSCVGGSNGNCDLHEYLRAGQIYDPNTHMAFPSNQIPNSSIPPAAVNLLNLLPLPNHGQPGDIVNNFVASGAEIFDVDQLNLRADYNATGKLKLLVRYSFADFRDRGSGAFGPVAGGAGTNRAGFAGIARTRNQGISNGLVYSFSPSLLTDFRFGFFLYHLKLDSPDFGTQPVLKITPGLNNDLFSSGMPDFEIPGTLSGQAPNPATGSDYLRFGYSPQVNSCNCPLRERENQFQWVNNWIKISRNHAFKWGADIRYLQNYRLASDKRRAGHLAFVSKPTNSTGTDAGTGGLGLATFLLGDVTTLDRYFANPNNPSGLKAGERQKRWFFYGQDTWRATTRLTLNFGLRWEIYFPQTVTGSGAGGFLIPNFSSPLNSTFNVPGAAGVNNAGNVKNSFTNLGPRLGIAYLVAPKTVIRAGYGRSFDVGFAGSIFGIAATQNPPVMAILTNLDNGLPIFSLGKPAPAFTFPQFTAPFAINDLYNALIQGSPFNQAVVYALPGKMRLPTVDAWNFTVQHELSPTMYFEISYVGNKGTHVLTDAVTPYYDLNQASLNNYVVAGNSVNNPLVCKPQQPTGNFCISQTITRRLFKPWPASIPYFGNNASSNYHSLQAKVEKHFRQGYGFLAHYTYAKALDYDGSYFNINPRVGYGPANFDRKHAFVLTNLWSLPLGRGQPLLGGISPAVDRIIGGWAINTISTWYSGLPFTPSYANCASDQSNSGAPCRPNLVGFAGVTGSRNGYFTTTGGTALTAGAFNPITGATTVGGTAGPWQRPAPGTIGDIGRNSFRGPGFFQSDVALAKNIPVTEKVYLRFRADAFNVFNRVNLGNPATCVDCPNAGVIRSLVPAAIQQRQFQFSLKLQF